MILMAGFRDNIGLDYGSYYNDYLLVKNGFFSYYNPTIEPGYSLLNSIVPSFRLLLIVMAMLAVLIRVISFRKNNLSYILLPVFFYYGSDFLFYDMGIIRQGISMSICFLSMHLIVEKNKKFYIYIFIAMLFHVSALLFVLMWFISNREYSRKFYYIGLAICTIIFIGGYNYTSIANSFVSYFGGEFIEHKFYKYMDYEQVDVTISFMRRMAFILLFIEVYKRNAIRYRQIVFPKRKVTNATWLYINGYFLSIIIFSFIAPVFSSIAGRFTAYFYSMYIFIYCDMFSDKKNHVLNFVWFVVFSVLLFYTFTGVLENEKANFLPYKWSGDFSE